MLFFKDIFKYVKHFGKIGFKELFSKNIQIVSKYSEKKIYYLSVPGKVRFIIIFR